MQLNSASKEQLSQWQEELKAKHQSFKNQNLKLDLTRGKPSAQQLNLSDGLDGILNGNYKSADGTDTRNYGGLDGIAEARQLGAAILGLEQDQVLAGGSSSLTMMHQTVSFAYFFGLNGTAWKNESSVKFLCPAPGYDRHFSICEDFAIEMIPVSMTETGPDMDQVESLIKADQSIKGIWCVPKYSNPTGIIYSDETVKRIAKLGLIAAKNFRVFWDNAYAVHDLVDNPKPLANIMAACIAEGTEDSVIQFASTSKITHAGSGVAFLGASKSNLSAFKKHLGISSIGPDKVNQLRHMRLLPDINALSAHMQQHAAILKPRFDTVLNHLQANFSDNDLGEWQAPEGGYFVSFDSLPGLAKEIVRLADEVGVKLTPAGATFPYGKDPQDRNIRLSPSFPSVEDIDATMQVFVNCVKLASVNQKLTIIS